ncbi:MAG: low molecular weight protein-tyrosine-phosphatase [Pseudoxanthomonas suwonensis]|nr:low molecular weight protein-tyrosine-phosphatase [Pseudoxanthomonas suwonensis]
MTTRLLMLCLGNICRSPTAEGVFRACLDAAGIDRIEVDSAGTSDWHVGKPPDARSVACARRNGVDIGGLRGRQLQKADFERFDWILCADADNLRDARARMPAGSRARLALLLPWARGEDDHAAGDSVPDPYYGDDDGFDRVWSLLDEAAAAAIAARAWERTD